ncbi:hypothetical protein [Mucilaginibacter rubeus]|uniref:hypothetical protein n=1 Tax=Mucilaginibacter rubeus TaxID=2027860 RepID=UPI0016675139|nr:hypothetical protein [Mucilaginibacter rubeus]GGB14243.1 hypothetical protein GCM10011500_32780 [Mucilaginibacter rubeus]
MNRYDFTQPGGFPFDQGVLQFMQDCINTAASAANLSGPMSILSGCVASGGSVSNGVVVINGEILPFTGGVAQAKVIIMEEATSLTFEDNVSRTVKYVRTAKFGDNGVSSYLWANFKRNTAEGVLARLDRLEGLLRPFAGPGGMVWWKGSIENIPAGWQEVVDWRGKLPMHWDPADADFDTVGKIGGAKDVTMTLDNLIKHTHPTNRPRTDHIGDQYEGNSLKSDDDRGLYSGDVIATGPAGSETPTPMKTINPYVTGMWIEPILGFFD